MQRIVGLLISGFAVRLYGAALGVWVAIEAARLIAGTLGTIAAQWPV